MPSLSKRALREIRRHLGQAGEPGPELRWALNEVDRALAPKRGVVLRRKALCLSAAAHALLFLVRLVISRRRYGDPFPIDIFAVRRCPGCGESRLVTERVFREHVERCGR
jgi:hypothetical protein